MEYLRIKKLLPDMESIANFRGIYLLLSHCEKAGMTTDYPDQVVAVSSRLFQHYYCIIV